MSFGSPYFTLPQFTYMRPRTIKEALEILSEKQSDARPMAGGVGLLNFMKERLVDPKVVIDLKGINELRRISYTKEEGLRIGATVTLNEILDYPVVRRKYEALQQAISRLSDHNLRNRSTLVGDLCEAIPWVDSPPPLIAYGAKVEVQSSRGSRTVPAEDFIVGMAQVDLKPDELVTSVVIPSPPAGTRARFYKFSSGSEFGIVTLAAVGEHLDEPEKRRVRFVFGGVADRPFFPKGLISLFRRPSPISQLVNEAVTLIRKTADPITDNLASSEYRLHLMEMMTIRAASYIFGEGGVD
jgi:CO/xanthine dehydrogenase FAD-binding subunit